MIFPHLGIGFGTLIYVNWLWSVRPYKLVLFGLFVKLLLTIMIYCNVERLNVGRISDFALNVPKFLLDKAATVCFILLPTTVHIAKKKPDSVQSISMFFSLLYATNEWLSMLTGSLCALMFNVGNENLDTSYKNLLMVTVPGFIIVSILTLRLIKETE